MILPAASEGGKEKRRKESKWNPFLRKKAIDLDYEKYKNWTREINLTQWLEGMETYFKSYVIPRALLYILQNMKANNNKI